MHFHLSQERKFRFYRGLFDSYGNDFHTALRTSWRQIFFAKGAYTLDACAVFLKSRLLRVNESKWPQKLILGGKAIFPLFPKINYSDYVIVKQCKKGGFIYFNERGPQCSQQGWVSSKLGLVKEPRVKYISVTSKVHQDHHQQSPTDGNPREYTDINVHGQESWSVHENKPTNISKYQQISDG